MKKEWILKARAGNTNSRSRTRGGASARTKANLHPVLTTVQGARGTFQSIRWQSLDETEHTDNKAPTYEQQDKIMAQFTGEVSANVLAYMKNYSPNKFRSEYLIAIKEENDIKRMLENARSTNNQEQIKDANKAYNRIRAKKSQLKAAAANRNIDLTGFLNHVLDFYRRKQEAAGNRTAAVTVDNTEDAPANSLPTVVEVDGRLELTPEGRQIMTADAWKVLSDEEEEAFNNAVIYALPSDMREVERASREDMEWQSGTYTGEVTIGLNGEAVPEGAGEWQQTAGTTSRRYTGSFASGQWQGEGSLETNVLIAPDTTGKRAERLATTYDGGFKQNLYHGRGVLTEYDENGEVARKYEGSFNNGIASGAGVLSYPSGVERGTFVNGELTGRGSIENYDTGENQEGLFSRGLLNGSGRILYGDGTMLEGVFKQGAKHGKFKLTAEDGTVTEKFYVENEEVTRAEYFERFGRNKRETLQKIGYSIARYDEETVAASFNGADLAELHNIVKSSLGEYSRGMTASVVTAASPNGANLEVRMNFGGGSLTRDYRRNLTTGELSVYHAYFKLPDGLQGNGAGKKIMGEMLRQYKTMGVNKVGVTAGLDGGGYTWALYGFHNSLDGSGVFAQFLDPTSPQLGASGGQDRVTQAKLNRFIKDIGREKYQALMKFCQSWPARKPFPMHVIANTFGKSGKAGANFLRGTQWSGTIDMSDPLHVAQWENYINPEKLAERDAQRNAEMAERAAQIAAERKTTGRGRRRTIAEDL